MFTRRQFIKSGCAVAAAAATSRLLASGMNAGDLVGVPGYRSLVCITLAGGADSFNMLVPMDPSPYRHYAKRRGELALTREELLPLSGVDREGQSFALHSGMSEIHSMYSAGEVAMVANVGSLPSPSAKPGEVCSPDLSHSNLIANWQHSSDDNKTRTGWAGRAADVMKRYDWLARVPTNISMSGRHVLQLGNNSCAANLQLNAYRQRLSSSVSVDFSYVNEQLTERAIAFGRPRAVSRKKRWLDLTENESRIIINDAIADVPDFKTRFSPDSFSKDLEHVARVIAARNKLGARRQIFYIHFDGWDHHHHLLENQAKMLPILSRGLATFRDALIELDVFDAVTTFTTSEFARSLEPNGGGSDHGWGGHNIVMGSGLNGGKIYGQYPDISNSSPLDTGGGCFTPTTSMDEYLAEMMLWFGIPLSDLPYVLPDLSRFWSAKSRDAPIGLFT
jgi:uncharacterized protein (DUF1501 family)